MINLFFIYRCRCRGAYEISYATGVRTRRGPVWEIRDGVGTCSVFRRRSTHSVLLSIDSLPRIYLYFHTLNLLYPVRWSPLCTKMLGSLSLGGLSHDAYGVCSHTTRPVRELCGTLKSGVNHQPYHANGVSVVWNPLCWEREMLRPSIVHVTSIPWYIPRSERHEILMMIWAWVCTLLGNRYLACKVPKKQCIREMENVHLVLENGGC